MAVLALALGAGVGIGAAIAPTAPPTPTAQVTRAVAAATAAGSFHYTESSTTNGQREDIEGAATAGGGWQIITQSTAAHPRTPDVFDLRLIGGTVYFRGNAPALLDQLGVSTAQVASLLGKWVSVVKTDALYHQFADGITVSSNLSQIHTTFVATAVKAVPQSNPPQTRITGGLADGKGRSPLGSASMVVVTATGLPKNLTGGVTSGTARLTLTWTFSGFGHRVTVTTPSSPITYASLGAKPPSTSAG